MKIVNLAIIALSISPTISFAQGNVGGGGGEPGYHKITEKMVVWLNRHLINGSITRRLHLDENNITAEALVAGYKDAMSKTTIKFIMEKDLQKECNNGDNIACILNKSSRTCLSLRDEENKIYKTECRDEAYFSKSEDVQFVNNLHEHLFIANLEHTYVDHSLYPISRHLAKYVKPKKVVEYDLTDEEVVENVPTKPECGIDLNFNGYFSIFSDRDFSKRVDQVATEILNSKGYFVANRMSVAWVDTSYDDRNNNRTYQWDWVFVENNDDPNERRTTVKPANFKIVLNSPISRFYPSSEFLLVKEVHLNFLENHLNVKLDVKKSYDFKKLDHTISKIRYLGAKTYENSSRALRKARLLVELKKEMTSLEAEKKQKDIDLVRKMVNKIPRCGEFYAN